MKFDSRFVPLFGRMFAVTSLTLILCVGVVSGMSGCGLVDGAGPDDDDPAVGFITDRPDCTGVWSGGTVVGASGATIAVSEGSVSMCANMDGPPTVTSAADLPADFPFDESKEDVLTADGDAVNVDLKGAGFNVDAEGSVTITLPYEPMKLPVGAIENSTNTFIRIWDPARDIANDVNGHVDVDAFTVTVRVLGLPPDATMAVMFRPGRVAVTTSDPAFVSHPFNRAATPFGSWAGRDWCVIHDYDSAELRDAVRQIEGYGQDPTPEEIAASVRHKVAQAGRDSQAVYEGLGLRAPWLYFSDDPEGPCGGVLGATPRYEVHVIDGVGSHYKPNDIDEATGPEDRRFGRLYIRSSRIGDDHSTTLGTVKASVAHEMVHAIQMGYEILAGSVGGLNEGTATVAGLYLDNGTIGVRSMAGGETFMLPWYLMVEGGAASYANQDFFAFVARRYGGSTLNFLPIVFQAMRDAINSALSGVYTQADADALRKMPGTFAVHKALDAAIATAVPGMGLDDAYKDFVTQRAFYHAPESLFGRNGETTYGFAAELYPQSTASWASIQEISASMAECAISKGRVKIDTFCPFSSRAIRIRASDVPEPVRKGDLEVTLTSAAGDAVVGWAWRDNQLQTLDGPTVFEDFGAFDGDELVIVVANAALSENCQDGVTVQFSLTCDEPTPDGEDPMECGSQDNVMACNRIPSLYYWNRNCEEYTGSHWYDDPSGLPGMCTITTDANWCMTGCARDHILGTCSMSMGENAEVVYYYYTTVDYASQGFDPQSWCGEQAGGWSGP